MAIIQQTPKCHHNSSCALVVVTLWEYVILHPLQWRHNGRGGVWNHQPHDCLFNRLFKRTKLQSSGSLAFVRGIHRWPVNSPHKWPVTRKMFPFDDVTMPWLKIRYQFVPPHQVQQQCDGLGWSPSHRFLVLSGKTIYEIVRRAVSICIWPIWSKFNKSAIKLYAHTLWSSHGNAQVQGLTNVKPREWWEALLIHVVHYATCIVYRISGMMIMIYYTHIHYHDVMWVHYVILLEY